MIILILTKAVSAIEIAIIATREPPSSLVLRCAMIRRDVVVSVNCAKCMAAVAAQGIA